MIQAPLNPGPQVPKMQPQKNYNAVKIDIINPHVNAQDDTQCCPPAQAPVTAPVYSYPKAQIYEVPKQSVYGPQSKPVSQPPAIQEVPSVPPPVIIQPSIINQAPAPVAAAPKTPEPTSVVQPEQPAAPQKVEVKAPEAAKPQVDLNSFITKLTSPNYDVQASAMEAIAEMAQNSPQKATELLDVKIIDTLLGIMNVNTSKLAGPTAEQIAAREKIMSGKPVTQAETATANTITPMEQAERNKLYSIYTVAILQKLYGSEIEKMNNTVVPLTELPGAAGIVEQVKNNPNPMVRTAGIDALSFIQRPEYKQDLTTLFTIAKNDKDAVVKQAATKALQKLDQVTNAPVKTEATQNTKAVAAPQDNTAKPENPKKAA